jgi:hypothetical protein
MVVYPPIPGDISLTYYSVTYPKRDARRERCILEIAV